MKISQKMSLALIFLLVITISVLSLVGYNLSKKSELESTSIILKNDAGIICNKTLDWMMQKAVVLDTVSNDLKKRYKSFDKVDNEDLNVFGTDTGMFCIYIVNNAGQIISSDYWEPEEGDDLTTRKYYKEAIKNDGLYFSDVYVDSTTGEKVITISMPLKNDKGEIKGVIATDVKLTTLLDFMSNCVSFNGEGKIYLVSESENILYSSSEDDIDQDIEQTNGLKDYYYDLLKHGEEVSDVISGKTHYAAFLKKINDVNWNTVVVVPKDVMYARTTKMRNYFIVLSLILIVFGVSATLFLANILKNRFNHLDNYISKIADYDLNCQSEDKHGYGKDEIGDMNRSIGVLVENFRHLITNINNLATDTSDTAKDLTTIAKDTADSASDVSSAVSNIAEGATSQAQESTDAYNSMIESKTSLEQMIENLNELYIAIEDINKTKEEGKVALERLSNLTHKSKDETAFVNQIIVETNDSATSISKASEMIQSIADQTNLLALNAAIELAVGM